jgi:photosystem I P700 chlorophyll a apoprotein A2
LTLRLWYKLGQANALEEGRLNDEAYLLSSIFLSHFYQLALIFFWSSSHLLHIGWQGRYSKWIQTIHTNSSSRGVIASAHAVRDPHFGPSAITSYSSQDALTIVSTSGLYQWYYTIGITSELQCFSCSSFLLFVGFFCCLGSVFHGMSLKRNLYSWSTLFKHHASALIGLSSLAWAGHIIHVALPASRHQPGPQIFKQLCHPLSVKPFFGLAWNQYASNQDGTYHQFGVKDSS